MGDNNGEELSKRGDKLFADRVSWYALQAELASKFAPDLGYLFSTAEPGAEYATHNLDITPMLAFNEWTGAMQMNLRPPDRRWFGETLVEAHEDLSTRGRDWLKRRTNVVWKLLYGKRTQSRKALRQADRNLSAFGEYLISISRLMERDGSFAGSLLFQTWHPAFYAYAIDWQGELSELHRKATMSAADLAKRFEEKNLSQQVRRMLDTSDGRMKPVQVRHAVLPTEEYEYCTRQAPKSNAPWVSIWYDAENRNVLRETPQPWPLYVLGRWQEIPPIQWGFSPPAMTAIATSRLVKFTPIFIYLQRN